MPLPDAVLQGLGLMPQYSSPAPLEPQVDNGGGLHPVVQQALGLIPPPDAPPVALPDVAPPPVPLSLPSAPDAPPGPDTPPAEYKVPVSAFGPQVAARPAAPAPAARPLTPDQKVAAADAAQERADQASQAANQSTTDVKVAEADAQVANYTAAQVAHDKAQADLKVEQDDYNKTHAQKQAILDGFNRDADSYKVDQNKYWNDMGVGQHIGVYIGMALSGLGNAYLGKNNPSMGAAENPVIKMIQQKAHDSIVAQMDERDQLEKKAGRAEHSLDRYDAFSKDRQAQLLARDAEVDRNLARMIATTSVKYGAPEALANGQAISAKLMEDSASKQAEAAQRAATNDHQKQQIGIEYAKLALATQEEKRKEKESKAVKQVWSPNQLAAINKSPGMPDPPVPPIDMSQEDYAKWLITQKQGQEYLTAKRGNDPETLARAQQVPGVVTKKGAPINFLPDEVKDIKKAKYNASELVRLSDELVGLVEKHGFDPGWTNSAYYQQAQQLHASIILTAKEQDKLGALSGSDIDIEQKKVGTSNPTQLRSSIEGIKSFRRQTVQGINSLIGTHAVVPKGEEVERWEPVDPSTLSPPKETQDDIIKKIILGKQSKDPGATYNPEVKRFEPNIAGLNNPNAQAVPLDSPEAIAPYQQRGQDEVGKMFPGVGQATRTLLETNWALMNSTDAAVRARGQAMLDMAAKDSSEDDVSNFAKFLLAKKRTYDMTEESPGRSLAAPRIHPEILRQLGLDAR